MGEPLKQPEHGCSIITLMGRWREHVLSLQSPATARAYYYNIRAFIFAANIASPGDITTQAAQLYIISLRQRGLSANTVKGTRNALRSFCAWLALHGHGGPGQIDVALPKVTRNALIDYLSKDELRQALGIARDYGVWLQAGLAILGGLRKGEVARLRWEDIDFGRKLVKIVLGKGQKSRQVPLCDPLLRELADGPETGVIYPNRYGQPQNMVAMHHLLDPIRGRIPKVCWSVLRHSFATQMLQNGVNIATISKWLGHSSLQTTLTYYASLGPDEYSDKINSINHLIV